MISAWILSNYNMLNFYRAVHFKLIAMNTCTITCITYCEWIEGISDMFYDDSTVLDVINILCVIVCRSRSSITAVFVSKTLKPLNKVF